LVGVQAVVSEKMVERIRLYASDIHACFTAAVDFLEGRQIAIKEVNVTETQAKGEQSHASFIISTKNVYGWELLKSELQKNIGQQINFDEGLAALSLIGEGLNRDSLTLLETIKLLADNHIPVHGITTTSFRISLLVPADQIKKSVVLCHTRWVSNN
jgi:aspartokinase